MTHDQEHYFIQLSKEMPEETETLEGKVIAGISGDTSAFTPTDNHTASTPSALISKIISYTTLPKNGILNLLISIAFI